MLIFERQLLKPPLSVGVWAPATVIRRAYVRLTFVGSLNRSHHRPRRRRAAYSIWAAAKILTMAATVTCNFTGSTTLGLSGQMIKIISGLSYGLMSWTAKRSAFVIWPEANSIGDDLDTVTSWGHRGLGERC